jgi:hypothetical protein
VNTVVNYSLSLRLGFAGAIERYVDLDGSDFPQGQRGISYMGVGLARLVCVIATCFTIATWMKPRKSVE